MAIVIRAVQLEGFAVTHSGGVGYLKAYDPEAFDGWGDAQFTPDIREAMRFADMNEAFELWKTVPKARPRRPDGQPNRPLTAFTITFEQVSVGPQTLDADDAGGGGGLGGGPSSAR